MNHSPFPWVYYTKPQPNGCPIVGDQKGTMVCMLSHSVNEPGQHERAPANAELIVALPKLIEINSRLREWDKKWPKFHDRSGESEREMNQICLDAAEILEDLKL